MNIPIAISIGTFFSTLEFNEYILHKSINVKSEKNTDNTLIASKLSNPSLTNNKAGE